MIFLTISFSGETAKNDAILTSNDFMEAFSADMKKELDKEIKKLSNKLLHGDVPKNEKELSEELKGETKKVEADLMAAFHKDLNLAMEKEISRISKRILSGLF